MKKIACALLALAAGIANAGVLYNNGPVVDATGVSVLGPLAITYGFGAQSDHNNFVSDDFNIPAGDDGWNISSLSFYGYQQSGTEGFNFTSAKWSIIGGDIDDLGIVLASGSNAVSNGGLAGYRVIPGALDNKDRAIYQIDVDIKDIKLPPGHYWLTWGLTTTVGPFGPWVPPTSDARQGNAAQSSFGDPFTTLIEDGSGLTVELPFAVNGISAAVPEPETYAMMLGGLALIGLARRRVLTKTLR